MRRFAIIHSTPAGELARDQVTIAAETDEGPFLVDRVCEMIRRLGYVYDGDTFRVVALD